MKNFEERKAEIFRRSEERINKQKIKRKRIITICIPLLICIGAYSIFILPAMMPAGSSDNSHQEIADIADIAVYPVTVEFFDCNGNLEAVYTKTEETDTICSILNSIINESFYEEAPSDESFSVTDSYSILIADSTGNLTTYTVSGNTLFNTKTKEYHHITDQQKDALDLFRKE